MPHDWPARLTEMSSRPPSISRRISFRRMSGHEEVRVRLEMLEQRAAVLREPEEMVLLADPVRLRPMNRARPVHEVLLLLEGLARHAIPAFVVPLVDVARGAHPADERLDARAVARLGRADEVVERDVQRLPDVEELLRHAVAVGERILSKLARLPKHILGVLVVPHDEMRLDAAQPLVPRDHVGRDLLVGGPQVGPAVRVVDGCR